MAQTAPDLAVVRTAEVDDAIREVHGAKAFYADADFRPEVLLRERENCVQVTIGREDAKLTPWQARYLASKLYRLSRRIRARTGTSS